MSQSTTPGRRAPLSPLGTSKSVKLSFGANKTPGKKVKSLAAAVSVARRMQTMHANMPAACFPQMDRFITARSAMDVEAAHLNLTKENELGEGGASANESKEEYQKMLAASLSVDTSARILAFKQKAPAPPEGHDSNLKGLYTENVGQAPCKKQFRHVPQSQERILDAPDLVDDYYLNLLDWNSSNIVSATLQLRHSRR